MGDPEENEENEESKERQERRESLEGLSQKGSSAGVSLVGALRATSKAFESSVAAQKRMTCRVKKSSMFCVYTGTTSGQNAYTIAHNRACDFHKKLLAFTRPFLEQRISHASRGWGKYPWVEFM